MAYDILVVDDEADIRDLVSGILEDEGHSTRVASNGVDALKQIKTRRPALVVLDVWLGDSERDGIKILENIKRDHPYVPVVMISGHGTIETAVTAIKKGAYDFIEKPFQSERLLLVVERALESSRLRRENNELKDRDAYGKSLVGSSKQIALVRQQVQKAAPSLTRVFISGKSGSGKEVVAREIHAKSPRSNNPLVVVNCASFSPEQLEIELFGTEIKNLDEAQPRKIGAVEQAHTGTLYLDEVTELPLPTQAKLLRVLQENRFSRIGSSQVIEVDIRYITSSSIDVRQLISEGSFREDLYYRLNVLPIHIPELKDRISDIPEISKELMVQLAASKGITPRPLSGEAIAALQACDWPGNVRQLKNIIERILIMSKGEKRSPVTVQDLPEEVTTDLSKASTSSANVVAMPLREARETFEREYLLAQVNRFGGNISQTARFVGMERSALHRKLKALGAAVSKS